jgi:Ca-activated chloride channel family protein
MNGSFPPEVSHMSLPLHFVRPAAQGFAAGLLLAIAGCGVSSKPDTAAAQPPAQGSLYREAKSSVYSEALRADATQAKTSPAAMPALATMYAPVAGEAIAGYRDEHREQYQALADNPIQSVAQVPVSTFSVDVDTGSYANVRRLLNQGRVPPEGALRLEEMVNYFPYDYAQPSDGTPFGVTTELAPSPWNPHTRLLRIGIKASDRTVAELASANLVNWRAIAPAMRWPSRFCMSDTAGACTVSSWV